MSHTGRLKSVARSSLRVVPILLALALGLWLGSGLGEHPQTAATPQAPSAATVWTCSMHPAVRLPAPGQCPICFMDLIPLTEDAGGSDAPRRIELSATARALAEVRTQPVVRRAASAEVRMVGKLDYDETRLATITSWVAGRIERLFVDYTGVQVQKGDHLVELYSPELYAAQEELLQALRAVRDQEARGARDNLGFARATLEAVREKLSLLGLREQQIAEIEEQEAPTYRTTIYAPMGGIVIHRNAQQGMYVQTGSAIYTIADLSHLWVRLEAYESDLPWLRYGQEVEFTTRALPGETFRGTIAFIDPVLDARTRTVAVRVNVDNPDGRLKPQMFVRARVRAEIAAGGKVMEGTLAGKWICPMHPEVLKDEPGACDQCGMDLVTPESLGYTHATSADAPLPLLVPTSAVLLTGRRAVVYVEVPDADGLSFEGREVVLGPRAGEHYLVERGLEEGERVVVHGAFKLDSALQIQARPSMMLPQVDAGESFEVGADVARDLQAIEAAWAEVLRAVEDPATAREAFAGLLTAIDALPEAELEGGALALWREIDQQLGNDAAQGSGARDAREVREAVAAAGRGMTRLREAFGEHAPAAREVRTASGATAEALRGIWKAYLDATARLAGDERADAEALAAAASALSDEVDADAILRDAARDFAAAADIDGQRVALAPLGAALRALLEAWRVEGLEAWVVHCPMAQGGDGADWLADEPEVVNPYFGAEMLRCGDVRRALHGGGGSHDH